VPTGEALIVVDDTAYVGDAGNFAAVDLEDGTELWTSLTNGSRLCHAGDTLYCIWSRGTLTALEDDTGEPRFEVEETFGNIDDLLALDETLLVGGDGVLVGYDPATGDIEWERATDRGGKVAFAVADGRLYVGGKYPLETYGPREGWDAIRRDGPKRLGHGGGPE
jgi:outer membrane protein assembly factor BamB